MKASKLKKDKMARLDSEREEKMPPSALSIEQ